MSEMSQAQGPVCAYVDVDPTDDMVPPGAESPRDPDAGHVGPQDVGAEDLGPQDDYRAEDVVGPDSNESSHLAGAPLPGIGADSERSSSPESA